MHGLYPKSVTETKCTANGNGWRDNKKSEKPRRNLPHMQATRSPTKDLSPPKQHRRAQSVTPPLPNHQQRACPMTPSLKHQRRTQEVNNLLPKLQHKWQAVTLSNNRSNNSYRGETSKCCAHGLAFELASDLAVPRSHPFSCCFLVYNGAAT